MDRTRKQTNVKDHQAYHELLATSYPIKIAQEYNTVESGSFPVTMIVLVGSLLRVGFVGYAMTHP